jgi:hypothetical protein
MNVNLLVAEGETLPDLEASLSLLASTNQKNVLTLAAFSEGLVELKASLGLLISTNQIRVTQIASVLGLLT